MFGAQVIPSMMPKGVEHRGVGQSIVIGGEVIPSMMPKGVEHMTMIGMTTWAIR